MDSDIEFWGGDWTWLIGHFIGYDNVDWIINWVKEGGYVYIFWFAFILFMLNRIFSFLKTTKYENYVKFSSLERGTFLIFSPLVLPIAFLIPCYLINFLIWAFVNIMILWYKIYIFFSEGMGFVQIIALVGCLLYFTRMFYMNSHDEPAYPKTIPDHIELFLFIFVVFLFIPLIISILFLIFGIFISAIAH